MKVRESGDFLAAWGGISSLELRLPIVWTEAQRRGFSLHEVAKWLCDKPARQVNLEARKGTIGVGHDADFVIWDPQREFTVNAATLYHRHKITPYDGEQLTGVVQKTFLRGRKIYDDGRIGAQAMGGLLL